MKYTTFRALLLAGGVLAALGSCATCALFVSTADPPPAPAATGASAQASAAPLAMPAATTPAAAQVGAKELPVSAFDRSVLAAATGAFDATKAKDALGARGPKVNLYRDPGEPKVNRAKVDLDRDEKWDEKWTFERAGGVKRQIAPADDESYTLEYTLAGEVWQRAR